MFTRRVSFGTRKNNTGAPADDKQNDAFGAICSIEISIPGIAKVRHTSIPGIVKVRYTQSSVHRNFDISKLDISKVRYADKIDTESPIYRNFRCGNSRAFYQQVERKQSGYSYHTTKNHTLSASCASNPIIPTTS